MKSFHEDDHAIWTAAYAAAFVSDFEAFGRGERMGFDGAARTVTAERAYTVADLAVARYHEWRDQEEGGRTVDMRMRDGEPEKTAAVWKDDR